MKLTPTMFYDPQPNPKDKEAHKKWRLRQIGPLINRPKEYYDQHRIRFKGFTRTEDTDVIELTNGKLTITFEDGGPGVGLYYENSNVCVLNLYYANGLSLDLFRDTVKENDINLQEI